MAATLKVINSAHDSNVLVDALLFGKQWASLSGAPLVVPVSYFAASARSPGAYMPNAAELQALQAVFDVYKHYINVDFSFSAAPPNQVEGIRLVVGKAAPMGVLGNTSSPGDTSYRGVSYSDMTMYRNNYQSGAQAQIQPGSADFANYLHEFGHAMGLAHPHDAGGVSSIFPGVSSPFGSYGQFSLNQGIYSIMSYNSGWRTGPTGSAAQITYGNTMTPMALDIQALQKLYGVNQSYHTGNDAYSLPGSNGVGTGYSCLWDAGGSDTIYGAANLANVIDLRAATGVLGEGGGGYVSYAKGIAGGFTIAVGAVIENAVGGNLGDVLRGNLSDNVLCGGGGTDVLTGGGGSDTFQFKSKSDMTLTSKTDVITDFLARDDHLDFAGIDANEAKSGDQAFSFVGSQGFTAAGQLKVVYEGADTLIYGNTNSDLSAEFCLKLLGHHVLSGADFIL